MKVCKITKSCVSRFRTVAIKYEFTEILTNGYMVWNLDKILHQSQIIIHKYHLTLSTTSKFKIKEPQVNPEIYITWLTN